MQGRTWLPAKPKEPPTPKVADDAREAIDALPASFVTKLKERYCKTPKNPQFNRPDVQQPIQPKLSWPKRTRAGAFLA